ncbi:MAG: hypothetical protein NZO58_01455 [Gemmataceae bacterium]|nr:hypothetical protein [Gemmataceae bacterium]
MDRTRLAKVILAGGLLSVVAGCMHGWIRGHRIAATAEADCTCEESPVGLLGSAVPPGVVGPALVAPEGGVVAQPYVGQPYMAPPGTAPAPTVTPLNPQMGPPPRIITTPAPPSMP